MVSPLAAACRALGCPGPGSISGLRGSCRRGQRAGSSSEPRSGGCSPGMGDSGWVNAVAVGSLPDGIPVIVSGGADGTVRVWRLADGSPVEEPLTGHGGWVNAVAVGSLPDGTPIIVSGRRRRHGPGVAASRRYPARASAGPTRTGTARRRSRRHHRRCGRAQCRRLPASAPAAHPLAAVLLAGQKQADGAMNKGRLPGTSGRDKWPGPGNGCDFHFWMAIFGAIWPGRLMRGWA
jgi:hypothetical protein